jgi:hypothetical protein
MERAPQSSHNWREERRERKKEEEMKPWMIEVRRRVGSLSTAFARIYLDIKRTMYINICICRRCVYPRRVHLDVNNTARKEGERERGGFYR